MLDAWESLARLLRQAGRLPEAIAALERADRLSPNTPQIVMGLSNLNVEAKRYDKARAFVEAGRALGSSGVEEQLATIALAEGDVAAAEKHARAAREASPEARLPLLLSARVAGRRGAFDEALQYLDRALALEASTKAAPMQGIRATRADALAHLGRDGEAEQDFRHEVTDFPENLDAWSRLALLYAAGGREKDFAALLTELTRRVPTRQGYDTAARVCEIVGDREGARRFREMAPSRAGG